MNVIMKFTCVPQYLSQCVVGASLEEVDDEEEEAEEEDGEPKEEVPKTGVYEIVGTVKDLSKPKPDFISEVVQAGFFQSRNMKQT
jgi:hypothetical protein